jgi:hypothetical protein
VLTLAGRRVENDNPQEPLGHLLLVSEALVVVTKLS